MACCYCRRQLNEARHTKHDRLTERRMANAALQRSTGCRWRPRLTPQDDGAMLETAAATQHSTRSFGACVVTVVQQLPDRCWSVRGRRMNTTFGKDVNARVRTCWQLDQDAARVRPRSRANRAGWLPLKSGRNPPKRVGRSHQLERAVKLQRVGLRRVSGHGVLAPFGPRRRCAQFRRRRKQRATAEPCQSPRRAAQYCRRQLLPRKASLRQSWPIQKCAGS